MRKVIKYISWELYCDKCDDEAFDGDFGSYTKAEFIKRCKKKGWVIKDEKILCPKCRGSE